MSYWATAARRSVVTAFLTSLLPGLLLAAEIEGTGGDRALSPAKGAPATPITNPDSLTRRGAQVQRKDQPAAVSTPVAAGEIVVKLRKGSKVAGVLMSQKGNSGANLAGPGQAHELTALLAKHGVTKAEGVFGRAAPVPKAGKGSPATQAKREALFRWSRLTLPAGTDVEKLVAELKAQGTVEAAEPVYEYRLADEIDPPITDIPDGTTDPMLPQQWYHTMAKSQAAWNYLRLNGVPMGGYNDVVVAVIDTGVDYEHQDLVGNIWTNPREIPGNGIDDDANGFIDDIHGCSVTSDSRSHSGDPIDLHGHGTHVAGIIASTAFNHVGGVGVAFGVQVMAIRAAHYSGTLTTTDISEAVLYAVDNGAEVINMSFGGSQYSQLVAEALEVAFAQAVLVASAGNNAGGPPMYPGALHYVLGIMSCDPGGRPSWFSNGNGDLTAPGEAILSTLPGDDYAAWSGTSMAAPVVSGIAGLMRSYFWQRDIWSSRFIMGSLVNSGPIVDAYKALTEPPQPGVTLLENWLFDDTGIDPANDGDGRVDSGETAHLALELMNRSGQAEGVTAYLMAWAEGAVLPDPYVTVTVPEVYFGDVGPFNTTDNGFIYNAEGVITGVEQPFVFEVSNDCPNEHTIEFELTITFYDGWNPDNTEPYTRVSRFEYVVQRGRNLPTVISSDLVLTADEYWIVSGPVLIEPGATLTIMPGTQVQWGAVSDDPYNPGPQRGIIFVRGNLRVQGTCEQPVAFFPSYMVGGQNVDIHVQGSGTADMAYARVRAAVLGGFRTIDHCYFDADLGGGGGFSAEQAKSTIFHRLYGGGATATSFDGCLFDAGWVVPKVATPDTVLPPRITNCTFLQDNEHSRPLSISPPASIDLRYFGGVATAWPVGNSAWNGIHHAVSWNGSTYATLPGNTSDQLEQADLVAQYFGGHVTSVANEEEQTFLQSYAAGPTGVNWPGCPPNTFLIGLTAEGSPGVYRWLDGSPLDYVNWETGYPTAYSALVREVVAVWNNPVPNQGLRSEAWGGRWRNLGGFGAFWEYVYWSGPAFILKLPGTWTAEQLNAEVANGNVLNFVRPRLRGDVAYNAFLSKYWDPNVNTWMRIVAAGGSYSAMNFNYWGTTSTTLIDHMIVDYYDNFGSARVDYAPPPAHGYTTTFPFVERLLINGIPAETVPKFGTERADFTVVFNRDMSMAVEPFVTFGPSSPYTDFPVLPRNEDFQPITSGWLDARTWQGSAWITPMSGDGYHLMRISGAVAADDAWLVSGYDVGRFRFEVRSMEVAAMTLQATGLEGAIHLQWQQDDFDLLAGYNLYRAPSATGPWEKLNPTVIPPGSEQYDDLAVIPAVPLYYKFSVLSTDFQESDFSNVAMAAALDTIAPTLTHVPVTTAAPARGMRVTATATDNLRVTAVTVHYRALGSTGAYTATAAANLTGDTWTATVPGAAVVAPGLEYYLVATDGISDVFSGTPFLPHLVEVANVPGLTSVTPNHGPAAGGTAVTLSGSLFSPGASVLFGGVLASSVVLVSDSQISCIAPAHFPAMVDVTVTNPDDTTCTLLNAFRFEDSGCVVSLPVTAGLYGSQVEIALGAANVTGLRAADVTLTFDASVLSARSVRLGTLTAGWALSANLTTAGRVVLSLASATGVTGSGALALITCDVVGAPPASTALTVLSAALNDGALASTLSDGLFTVTGLFSVAGKVGYADSGGAVPGTALTLVGSGSFAANSDAAGLFSFADVPTGGYLLTPTRAAAAADAAEITAYDASLALQAASVMLTLSANQVLAADVNRNGLVSAMDAAYILEKAVGLIVGPFPGTGKEWDFAPQQRTYALLNSDQTGQDFTAILIGDVSGNWAAAAKGAPLAQKSAEHTVAGALGPVERLASRASAGEPSGRAALAKDGSVGVAVGDVVGVVGETVDVPISLIASAASSQSLDVVLGFDATVLAVPAEGGVTLTAASAGAFCAYNASTAGQVRLGVAGAVPLPVNTPMLTLRFEILRVSPEPVPIVISESRLNEGQQVAVPDDGSVTTQPPFSVAPSSVGLLAASDTGVSDMDNLTKLNNASAERRLSFDVSGTVAGATVTVYADGTEIGSAVAGGATTTVLTDGATPLAAGAHAITATQAEPGKNESPVSPTLTVTLDLTAPTLLSALARKAHGAAGTFDLVLPIAAPWGVECRMATVTTLSLVFGFSEAVHDGAGFAATVTSGTATPGASELSSNTLTLALTGVADSQWLALRLNPLEDPAGNALDLAYTLGILAGDVTLNGTVNAQDILFVRYNSLQPLDQATNFRYDINASGATNAQDVLFVRYYSLHALPPP